MQKLLTRGIGHSKFKTVKWLFGKEIEIPKEWKQFQIKDLTKVNSEQIKDNYNFDKIEYIDILSIENFQVTKLKKFNKDKRPSRAQRIIKHNDIIVSTVRPYLKAFSLIIFEKHNLICSTGFTVIRSKIISDTGFLFNYFKSHFFELNFIPFMEGMAYPAITSSVVSDAKIFVPNDVKERKKIASILSGVDAYIQKNQEYKEKLERLKKGLMQKLLTGQIRVKLD